MLKNILSQKDCAKCRICCIFDKYDVWETPIISQELYNSIKKNHPQIKFVSKGDSGAYIFNMEDTWDDKEEIFRCPALSDTGCTLGTDKPFDCKIWPYRVMRLENKAVISIASICPEMYQKPLSALIAELDNGLADIIENEINKNPQIIKPYENGYPILKVL